MYKYKKSPVTWSPVQNYEVKWAVSHYYTAFPWCFASCTMILKQTTRTTSSHLRLKQGYDCAVRRVTLNTVYTVLSTFRHAITHLHPNISWRCLFGSPKILSINFCSHYRAHDPKRLYCNSVSKQKALSQNI